VDRHRFDSHPDLDSNFHFYPDPDPYQDWHPNDADPLADPTPSFMLESRENFNFIHRYVIIRQTRRGFVR
jgi:hypothetical protein